MKREGQRGHARTIYFGDGRTVQNQRPIVLSRQATRNVAPIWENTSNNRNKSKTVEAPKSLKVSLLLALVSFPNEGQTEYKPSEVQSFTWALESFSGTGQELEGVAFAKLQTLQTVISKEV